MFLFVTGTMWHYYRGSNHVWREVNSQPSRRGCETTHCEEVLWLWTAIPQRTYAER